MAEILRPSFVLLWRSTTLFAKNGQRFPEGVWIEVRQPHGRKHVLENDSDCAGAALVLSPRQWFAGDPILVCIVRRPIARLSLSRGSEANCPGGAAIGEGCDVFQRHHWRPGAQAQESPTEQEGNYRGQRCDLAQAIPAAQLDGTVVASGHRTKAAL